MGSVGPVMDRLGLTGGLRCGGDSAFYVPSTDAIHVPAVEAFGSVDAFRASVLHEAGHATGHRDRLARDFSGRFGDESYAFEELVAELASAFTQAALGLRADIENHASYIDNWQRVLTRDSRAFVKGCTLAQQAADLLLAAHAADKGEEQTQPLQRAA